MEMPKLERRVVFVDDSRTIQAILDNAFSKRRDFRVVGCAADAITAAEVIRRLMPDVVTIDLAMPYLDGEALLTMIGDLDRVCKVVVSDKCSNPFLQTKLMEAGATLCLTKRNLVEDPDGFFKQINRAADQVARGNRHYLSTFGGPICRLPPVLPVSRKVVDVGFPVPADEKYRLDIGRRKNLFNARRETQFDAITRNTAKLTAFPIALLTFIDQDTQWIKSTHGLDVESTPREQAFCNYTISQGGAFVVGNAPSDERFKDNPLVTRAPNIRSYTGYPITLSDGVAVGALCVVDSRVRTVSKHALDQLSSMAEIVAEMIELRPAVAA
jgi:CheY-like chemotaxis protein